MVVALSLLNRNVEWGAAGSCTRGLCAARKWNWSGTMPSHTQQGSAAVAKSQKILDHRGLLWIVRPAHGSFGPRSRLRAGGETQAADADAARIRARAAHNDFFTLWKDADPDLPLLKEAKAEYAKLL